MADDTTRASKASKPLLAVIAVVGVGVGALAGVAVADWRSPLEEEQAKVDELRRGVQDAEDRLERQEGSFFALAEGDCFNTGRDTYDVTGNGTVPAVVEGVEASVVPCGEPHREEVIAIVPHPDGGDDYPGADALYDFGAETCAERFTEYVGVELAASTFRSINIYPTEQSWAEGDHQIVCLTFTEEEQTGSARDSGS